MHKIKLPFNVVRHVILFLDTKSAMNWAFVSRDNNEAVILSDKFWKKQKNIEMIFLGWTYGFNKTYNENAIQHLLSLSGDYSKPFKFTRYPFKIPKNLNDINVNKIMYCYEFMEHARSFADTKKQKWNSMKTNINKFILYYVLNNVPLFIFKIPLGRALDMIYLIIRLYKKFGPKIIDFLDIFSREIKKTYGSIGLRDHRIYFLVEKERRLSYYKSLKRSEKKKVNDLITELSLSNTSFRVMIDNHFHNGISTAQSEYILSCSTDIRFGF